MVADKILSLYQKRWQKTFKNRHPRLWSHVGDTTSLRLLLGPRRSGTTWAMNVLSYTKTPVRVVVEPLFPFRPKARFSLANDRVAHPYKSEIDKNHVAFKILESFTFPSYSWSKVVHESVIMKNDPGFSRVIVKEVHALLITEPLLKTLGCKAIFLLRDPLRVVDSQIAYTGFGNNIWENEYKYIQDKRFLSRYFPDKSQVIIEEVERVRKIKKRDNREIKRKILTVAVLNGMLCDIAKRLDSVMLVHYEDLCLAPETIFPNMAAFFDLVWDEKSSEMLKKTMRERKERYDPNSIYRDTQKQLVKEFRHIKKEEIDRAVEMMERCGLLLYPPKKEPFPTSC